MHNSDIMALTAVSYFSKLGEERTAHHPSKGWDGDSVTCYISGYHTAPWWEVTFKNKHVITGVEMYGMILLITSVCSGYNLCVFYTILMDMH